MELGHHQTARPGEVAAYHLYVILDVFSRYVVGWMKRSRSEAGGRPRGFCPNLHANSREHGRAGDSAQFCGDPGKKGRLNRGGAQ
jgi:hypothetical protein